MIRILVVEDETAIRELLTRQFRGWGYEVSAVATANEALEQMQTAPAAVAFCDIVMPGQSGLWLLRQIRAQWPTTAVVMISAVDTLARVAEARRLGAVDYVPKPVGREMLLQALRRALASIPTSDGGSSAEPT